MSVRLAPDPSSSSRWRLTLHDRAFTETPVLSTLITELPHARGRQLVRTLDKAASLTFTLNGTDPEAYEVKELEHEVVAWRADRSGNFVPMFRGIVGQSEDSITEQAHVVIYTCHDYFAKLGRRFTQNIANYTQTDQDSIVNALATVQAQPGGLAPGHWLPVRTVQANPDGTTRAGLSGRLRDRTYPAQTAIDTAIDDLAHVIDGFDYDMVPVYDGALDALVVYYPSRGVSRPDPVLLYGSTVSTVTRTVNSADYGNLVRVVGGQAPGAAAGDPPLSSRVNNPDATGTVVGLWEYADNAADVTIQSTLDEKAQGDLAQYGVILPSYTLGLRPGFYESDLFDLGDSLTLVIKHGRLDVHTETRVVGITYDVNDDGQEDVHIDVGRSPKTLLGIVRGVEGDVAALARR